MDGETNKVFSTERGENNRLFTSDREPTDKQLETLEAKLKFLYTIKDGGGITAPQIHKRTGIRERTIKHLRSQLPDYILSSGNKGRSGKKLWFIEEKSAVVDKAKKHLIEWRRRLNQINIHHQQFIFKIKKWGNWELLENPMYNLFNDQGRWVNHGIFSAYKMKNQKWRNIELKESYWINSGHAWHNHQYAPIEIEGIYKAEKEVDTDIFTLQNELSEKGFEIEYDYPEDLALNQTHYSFPPTPTSRRWYIKEMVRGKGEDEKYTVQKLSENIYLDRSWGSRIRPGTIEVVGQENAAEFIEKYVNRETTLENVCEAGDDIPIQYIYYQDRWQPS